MEASNVGYFRVEDAMALRVVAGRCMCQRMSEDISQINDMGALRAAIDALDTEIAGLLARRLALIDRAAAIKARDGLPARIGWRVDEVVANARRNAANAGLDPDLAEALWRQMIEHAIAREDELMKESRR